ncbi:MAG: nicotinamide riboside transporter PnuC [Bacteroidales bacterium]
MILIEIVGALLGFLYVLLEIKQKRLMWIVGAVSALFYIAIFLKSSLFASMILQLWYLGASFYGWIKWGRSTNHQSEEGVIVQMSSRRVIISLALSIVGVALTWALLKFFSNHPQPLADAFITSFSLLATYWVAHKFIYHWYIWIGVDLVAAILYLSQGLLPTALLYLIYCAIAVVGVLHWRKFKVLFE